MAFVNRLAQLEVRERMEEVLSIHASESPNVPLKELAICVNFSTFPAPIKLLSLDVVCGPNDGGLAISVSKVGNCLWNEVKQSNGERTLVKATMIDGSDTIVQYLTTTLKEYPLPYDGKLDISMLFTKNPLKTVKDVVVQATIVYAESLTNNDVRPSAYDDVCQLVEALMT